MRYEHQLPPLLKSDESLPSTIRRRSAYTSAKNKKDKSAQRSQSLSSGRISHGPVAEYLTLTKKLPHLRSDTDWTQNVRSSNTTRAASPLDPRSPSARVKASTPTEPAKFYSDKIAKSSSPNASNTQSPISTCSYLEIAQMSIVVFLLICSRHLSTVSLMKWGKDNVSFVLANTLAYLIPIGFRKNNKNGLLLSLVSILSGLFLLFIAGNMYTITLCSFYLIETIASGLYWSVLSYFIAELTRLPNKQLIFIFQYQALQQVAVLLMPYSLISGLSTFQTSLKGIASQYLLNPPPLSISSRLKNFFSSREKFQSQPTVKPWLFSVHRKLLTFSTPTGVICDGEWWLYLCLILLCVGGLAMSFLGADKDRGKQVCSTFGGSSNYESFRAYGENSQRRRNAPVSDCDSEICSSPASFQPEGAITTRNYYRQSMSSNLFGSSRRAKSLRNTKAFYALVCWITVYCSISLSSITCNVGAKLDLMYNFGLWMVVALWYWCNRCKRLCLYLFGSLAIKILINILFYSNTSISLTSFSLLTHNFPLFDEHAVFGLLLPILLRNQQYVRISHKNLCGLLTAKSAWYILATRLFAASELMFQRLVFLGVGVLLSVVLTRRESRKSLRRDKLHCMPPNSYGTLGKNYLIDEEVAPEQLISDEENIALFKKDASSADLLAQYYDCGSYDVYKTYKNYQPDLV